jgi:hypothetical protein
VLEHLLGSIAAWIVVDASNRIINVPIELNDVILCTQEKKREKKLTNYSTGFFFLRHLIKNTASMFGNAYHALHMSVVTVVCAAKDFT